MHENWMHIKYRIAPQWGKNEKEKSANEVNRAGAWERERVVEPEDMPLMLPICPPPIKLSLIFQHIQFSTDVSSLS